MIMIHKKLKKLSLWLETKGFAEESTQASALVKSGSTNISYTINSGDTLGGIAEKFDVKQSDIVSENTGLDPDKLAIDQVLLIPPSKLSFIYKITSGDTLSGVATENKVSVQDILGKNKDLTESSVLSVGREIRVPYFSVINKRKEEEEAWDKEKWSGDPDELMAMTLLGEGGTLSGGEKVMREVRTVIQNRMKYLSQSLHRVVFNKDQFEFWGKNPDARKVIKDKAYGKGNTDMWPLALKIAKETVRDPDVKYSTHYWNPGAASPSWRHKVRVVSHNKGKHVYGVVPDGSTLSKGPIAEVSEEKILELPLYSGK